METRAISVKDAEAFLVKHERAYKEPAEPICAVSVGEQHPQLGWLTRGVAILGRMDDETAALSHVYCDGASQGYTMLYGQSWRALKALGYKHTVL